ncbi:hypothetical protein GCM10028809_68860 [Spirosoma gilvum]
MDENYDILPEKFIVLGLGNKLIMGAFCHADEGSILRFPDLVVRILVRCRFGGPIPSSA